MALEIYKKGQGSLARVVTGVGLLAVTGFGCLELKRALEGVGDKWRILGMPLDPAMVVAMLLFLLCAAGIGWLVLVWRRLVDYLILTEAELRKVAWPSKRDLWQQTLVVIAVSLILGALILVFDLIFSNMFRVVGVF
jgi:preprotein translocase subunit SecE